MEVLLNTTWLLVAIGAFACWRPARQSALRKGRGGIASRTVLALVCALLLLFPVISLTDDLHAEQYPIEDSSRSVIKARHLERGYLHADGSPFLAATCAAHSMASLTSVAGLVVLLEVWPFDLTLSSAHLGRSPPCLP